MIAVRKLLALFLLTLVVTACGGGGSSSSSAPAPAPTPAPEPPPPEPEPEPIPALEGVFGASRLASRATFGLNYDGILAIDALGQEAWLEQQFDLPASLHDPVVTSLLTRQGAGEFAVIEEGIPNLEYLFRRLAWWQQTMNAEDQLRQRVAYALSQIFVVSDTVDVLVVAPYALSNYYDMLLTHAFGNYRDLLLAVTLHPSMGVYLSHIDNAKADPEANTFPDENYAREVMQLFSIGLYELNPDGSEQLDAAGELIPTYDNDDIREFARIFTGLSFGDSIGRFGKRVPNFTAPMQMFQAFHDTDEKTLLRGTVIPAGQGGLKDIEDAVDNLAFHPNVAPFIGRQLIQRLVMSNPSPAYVERVSAAFNGGAGGEYGDMRAVIQAVLLDPEALAVPDPQGTAGKLREPLLRITAALRQLNVSSSDGFYANTGYFFDERIKQHPLSAPSVFNFYLPGHRPLGEIADAGLVAPEFQITNSSTVVAVSNLVDTAVISNIVNDFPRPPFQAATLDLDEYLALAENPDALVDRLDLVMTYGTLSDDMRASIIDSIAQVQDLEIRVRAALYLLLISPDYAVEL